MSNYFGDCGCGRKNVPLYDGYCIECARKRPNAVVPLMPGQVYEDTDHIYHDEGCVFAVILMSKEPREDWRCAEFQEYQFGMYERFYGEREIRQLRYIGYIADLKKAKG